MSEVLKRRINRIFATHSQTINEFIESKRRREEKVREWKQLKERNESEPKLIEKPIEKMSKKKMKKMREKENIKQIVDRIKRKYKRKPIIVRPVIQTNHLAIQCKIDISDEIEEQIDNKLNEYIGRENDSIDCTLFVVINSLKALESDLNRELSYAKKAENYWKTRVESIDQQLKDRLPALRFRRWCRICGRSAKKEYYCCFNASYCSFLHKYSHSFHFIECNRKDK